MRRVRNVAPEYWFELLIAVMAIAGMLELVVGRDSPGAPGMSLWFSIPAVAILVLPLFVRRRFPFAAPAAYWLIAAALTYVDGLLIPFIGSLGVVRKELRPWIGMPAGRLPVFPALPRTTKDRAKVERDYLRTEFRARDPALRLALEAELDRPGFLAQEPFYQAHRPFKPGERWADLPLDPLGDFPEDLLVDGGGRHGRFVATPRAFSRPHP